MKMRRCAFLVLLVSTMGLTSCATRVRPLSETERNGFIPQEPLRFMKQAFSVRDNERQIVGVIRDASNSIAYFAHEVMQLQSESSQRNARYPILSIDMLSYVLPEARERLRLPPKASRGGDSYVFSTFYCWKELSPGILQVNIEWADITTPKRYTDSYVFKKIGPKWYFERHGDLLPFRYVAKGYYVDRPC